jgi:hypothetical protein
MEDRPMSPPLHSSSDYFLEKAQECLRLARSDREIAESLEAMGHEFLKKAAEITKSLQQEAPKS